MNIDYYKKDRYGVPDNIIADEATRTAWQRLTGLKTIQGTKIEDLQNLIEAIGDKITFTQVLPPEA